jgi:hypothetical protein
VPEEIFTDDAATTVTTGGTGTPGTETWTVASSAGFPAASNSAALPTQFHVADPALPFELMTVTNVSGTTWSVTRGAEGTTAVGHQGGFTVREVVSSGSLAQLRDRVDWYNVITMFGADPTGVTDSYTAIQAAINAASGSAATGGVVYFPAGTYSVGTTLQLLAGICYLGADKNTTIIQMKAGANLNAIAASTGWVLNTGGLDTYPMVIREISWYGNTSNQTSGAGHGVVLQGFWTYVQDCMFTYTRGDGLRFDYFCQNGTNHLSGTATENRVTGCQFRFNGAAGFHVNDPTFTTFTDGWVKDCAVQSATTNGFQIDSSAGWEICNNHLYGLPQSGISVAHPYQTQILGNYIETWGTSATSGTYCGIDCFNGFVADTGYGSVIADNYMNLSTAAGNVGSFLFGIGIQASSGSQATMVIAGNLMNGTATLSANYYGIVVTNQNSASSSFLTCTGNVVLGVSWTQAYAYTANGGVVDFSTLVPSQPSVPATKGSGASFYADANGVLSTVSPAGQASRLQRAQYAATSAVTVATSAAIASLGSLSVPANEPVPGAKYRITGHGQFGIVSANPATTYICDLRWGGTAGTLLTSLSSVATATSPLLPVSTALTSVPIEIEGEVEFRTATTCIAWLKMTWTNSTTAATAATVSLASIITPVTVTVSSAQLLSLDWTWGTSNAANTITIASSGFERIA